MRLTTGYEYKKARIELIPLLDVVFLLLVFFIYAILSMSVHQGVRVTLPVGTGEAQQKTIVRIVLDANNALFLDGTPCDMQACVKRVAESLINTAAGITVALLTLVPFNAFVSKVQRETRRLEQTIAQFETAYRKGCDHAPDDRLRV